MAVHSSQVDVEKILSDMRNALQQGKFFFAHRSKNMATLSALGLLMSDVRDELLNLSFSDYINGPEIDYGFPTSDRLWVFKKSISGQVIYIKFKVEYQTDGKVRVVSFHIDETA